MTISSSSRTAGPFIGNGITKSYPFDFRIFAREDLLVGMIDVGGTEKILTLDADYSVTMNPDQTNFPGGTITLSSSLPTYYTLSMTSNIPYVQSLDLTNNGGFYPKVINDTLDRIVVQIQQVAAKVGGGLNIGGAAAVQLVARIVTPVGASLIGTIQNAIGATARTVQAVFSDRISVKDFGAVGDDVADDTAAITKAMAHAVLKRRSVYFPSGIYRTSATIKVPYGVRIYGESEFTTVIRYSGAGDAVYIGGPGDTTIISYGTVDDMTIICTNRASTVNGINCDNAVYFAINRVSVFGSGSPNSNVAADRVLYGNGVLLTNNTIIGYLNKVTTRLWENGRYYKTLAGSESWWTAAIVDGGQGEVAGNMRGILVGDPTVNFTTAAGVTFRDLCIQGNYGVGVAIIAGDNTIIESCYFEGNANRDVVIGGGVANPVCIKVINNQMGSADIGPTPYGNFPYIDKVWVYQGSFAEVSGNNMSIDTAIPLVRIGALAQETIVRANRLNSTIDAQQRIKDDSTTTITADNHPEKPRFATGVISRSLNAGNESVTYGGVGFRPTEIEFYACVEGSTEHSEGAAGIGIGLQQRCTTSDATGVQFSNAQCIRIIRSGAGNEQGASLSSFTADGFTLAWAKLGAPPANNMTVNYIARR